MDVLTGEYLGMRLALSDIDVENAEFFRYCGQHDLHLQKCDACGLFRYPPTTGCPWCSTLESTWAPIDGAGTVYSYFEVEHAIQPAFRDHLPYLVLLVELDTQRGQPTKEEALRVVGNLVDSDGRLAPPDLVTKVGIGSRVKVFYSDVGKGFAIPNFILDSDDEQPVPWRYPE